MADLRRFLTASYWREHSVATAYWVWGIFLFLVFMVGNFPYQDTLSTILKPTGWRISYGDQRTSFPIGVKLEDIRLTSTIDPTGQAVFQSADMTLTPALGSLLMGHPGLHLNAEAYDGRVYATVRRVGDGLEVDLDVRDLNLARYRALPVPGASLNGLFSGTGSVALSGYAIDSGSGKLELNGKGFALKPGSGFPDIAFADCKAVLKLEHGVVKIEQIEGNGADLKALAEGELTLAPDLGNSTIRMTLQLEPTPAGRSHLGIWLGLLPHPPGSQPYTIRGPLHAPSIS